MLHAHFTQFAAYNRWANARLYAVALEMPEALYRQRTGVFFGSLHGTLNHLLATDRIWLKRLTGKGEAPDRVDATLFDDRHALAQARVAEDARLVRTIEGYDDAAYGGTIEYATTSGKPQRQLLSDILGHLFNHQTHHRGQAHSCLSILTGQEPPTFDLLAFQRGVAATDLPTLTF